MKRHLSAEEKKAAKLTGARLARVRQERGVTQVELAKQVGLTQSLLSDYERGRLRLSGEIISRMARALRISADDILGLKPQRPHSPGISLTLARRLRRIDQLPARDRQAILRTIDAFLDRLDTAS